MEWRRQPESNRRIAVLQTAALATWLCRLTAPRRKETAAGKPLIHRRKKRAGQCRARLRGNRWSGRRDSNPQPSAWQADALPLSYSRIKPIVSLSPPISLAEPRRSSGAGNGIRTRDLRLGRPSL